MQDGVVGKEGVLADQVAHQEPRSPVQRAPRVPVAKARGGDGKHVVCPGAVVLKLKKDLGARLMDDGCQANRIVEQAGRQDGVLEIPQTSFVHDAVAEDEEPRPVATRAFLVELHDARVEVVLLFEACLNGGHDDPVLQEVRSHLERQKQMRIGGHDAREASPDDGCRRAPARTARC